MAAKKFFRTILCPVDFSEHSRQALRYAALLVSRNEGRLVVVFVEHPMLAAAAAIAYDEKRMIEKCRAELRRFVERTIAAYALKVDAVTLDVRVGRPHEEIARAADHVSCDLIVMGSHGLTGATRMMLGSTTHRVLRDSPLPVLAIPPAKGRGRGPSRNWPGKWALAPVDFGTRDRADAVAAAVVTRELGARLLLVHVVEPIGELPWIELDAARRNHQRQRRALARLTRLQEDLAWVVDGCRVQSGKAADEIATLASNTNVGVVVMTRRRGQGLFGPHQGSISYQVLCEAGTPVLALPSNKEWMQRLVSLVPTAKPRRA
jgi:nucleotide-binding universal stress UspA family protein